MPEETSATTPQAIAPLRVGAVRRGVRLPLLPLLGRVGHGDHRARGVVGVARVCGLIAARRPARLRSDPRHELGRAGDPDLSARAAARADAGRHRDLVGEHLRLRGVAGARRVFRAQARAADGARSRGVAAQSDDDRDGVELLADRADGSHLLRLRRHADLVRPFHARRARRRRRDLRASTSSPAARCSISASACSAPTWPRRRSPRSPWARRSTPSTARSATSRSTSAFRTARRCNRCPRHASSARSMPARCSRSRCR